MDKDTYFHEMSISASRGSAHEDYDRDDYFAKRYGLGVDWKKQGLYKLADGNADLSAIIEVSSILPTFFIPAWIREHRGSQREDENGHNIGFYHRRRLCAPSGLHVSR